MEVNDFNTTLNIQTGESPFVDYLQLLSQHVLNNILYPGTVFLLLSPRNCCMIGTGDNSTFIVWIQSHIRRVRHCSTECCKVCVQVLQLGIYRLHHGWPI